MTAGLGVALVSAVRGDECIFVAALGRTGTGLGLRGTWHGGTVVEDSVLQGQRVDDAQQAHKGDQFSHWRCKCTHLLPGRRKVIVLPA
jgi:hypothetical protein